VGYFKERYPIARRGSAMREEFSADGRTIPGEVMEYIRKIAVRAVREKGYSPEAIINILGLSRNPLYVWLKLYDEGGYGALQSHYAPGAEPLLTAEIEQWLKETVLRKTPEDFGYDTVLWTRDILAELIKREFGVEVSGRTVSEHLRKMGLTYQKPHYRAREQDPQEVEHFIRVKFPRILRLARRIGAEMFFEDETGIGLQTHSGRTWGLKGQAPDVVVTGQRGGFSVLSGVKADGHMRYHLVEGKVNSERYIEFLKQLLRGRKSPLILIVDRIPFHGSKKVRDFISAHRKEIRVFFLPGYSPERNPDEQVGEEIKDNKIGRQSIRNKADLKRRLHAALKSLQRRTDRVMSFFRLPETLYAAASSS
jgi:transposase